MLPIIIISILLALILAPLGCLILWKKYVYFSDGLAHATMFASIISIIFDIPIIWASLINSLLFIYLIFKLKKKNDNNATIGLASSFMVGASLLLADLFPESLNIARLLFGDIILGDINDVILLSITLLLNLAFFYFYYQQLILAVLSPEIAFSRGVDLKKLEVIFLILLSFAIMMAIKIVGVLLVTAIILVPAMTARLISYSPLSMLIISIFIALATNLTGLLLSFNFDLAFSPIIIIVGVSIFILINSLYKRNN